MRRLIAASIISFSLAASSGLAVFAADDDGNMPDSKLPATSAPNPDDADSKADSKKDSAKDKKDKSKVKANSTKDNSKDKDTAKAKDKDTTKAVSSDKDAKPKSKAPKKASSGGFGARVASTMVGAVAGIPVQWVRKSKQEYINATKDLVGESTNIWAWALVSPICVPAGLASGMLQGVVLGPYDAYKYSADEPFSAEAFSMGDAK